MKLHETESQSHWGTAEGEMYARSYLGQVVRGRTVTMVNEAKVLEVPASHSLKSYPAILPNRPRFHSRIHWRNNPHHH